MEQGLGLKDIGSQAQLQIGMETESPPVPARTQTLAHLERRERRQHVKIEMRLGRCVLDDSRDRHRLSFHFQDLTQRTGISEISCGCGFGYYQGIWCQQDLGGITLQ